MPPPKYSPRWLNRPKTPKKTASDEVWRQYNIAMDHWNNDTEQHEKKLKEGYKRERVNPHAYKGFMISFYMSTDIEQNTSTMPFAVALDNQVKSGRGGGYIIIQAEWQKSIMPPPSRKRPIDDNPRIRSKHRDRPYINKWTGYVLLEHPMTAQNFKRMFHPSLDKLRRMRKKLAAIEDEPILPYRYNKKKERVPLTENAQRLAFERRQNSIRHLKQKIINAGGGPKPNIKDYTLKDIILEQVRVIKHPDDPYKLDQAKKYTLDPKKLAPGGEEESGPFAWVPEGMVVEEEEEEERESEVERRPPKRQRSVSPASSHQQLQREPRVRLGTRILPSVITNAPPPTNTRMLRTIVQPNVFSVAPPPSEDEEEESDLEADNEPDISSSGYSSSN